MILIILIVLFFYFFYFFLFHTSIVSDASLECEFDVEFNTIR